MDYDYFKNETHISNSWLGQFKRFLNNEPQSFAKEETLNFGSLFHTASLETDLYQEGHNKMIENMRDSLRKNLAYGYIRNHKETKIEHEHYRRCKVTGLYVRMKIDLQLYTQQADIKSTTCTTDLGFLDTCHQYGYHRQAAFYMDMAGGETFTFFGVQKKHPFKVFTRVYTKNGSQIKDGREEYLYLMNKAKSMGLF
jgi:PDDEXK-like domain of unknown function (DUF3799)